MMPLLKRQRYTEVGQANRAAEVFSQALQAANAIETPTEKIPALAGIALEYTKVRQQSQASEVLSQALQIAQSITDPSSNSYTLRVMAEQYIYEEQYDSAFAITQAIKDTSERSAKLQQITEKYIDAGRYDTALQVVNTLEAPSDKARWLVAIANKYIQTEQTNKASEILAQAFQITQTIEGPESKVFRFGAEGGTQVDDPYDRASLLEEIALKYAQVGQYNQALQVAKKIEDASNRNQLSQRLACYR